MHRINENSGTSMNAESTPTPAAPTNRLISAVTIGRPMATTDPKAISSTMMATAMPMSSLLGSFASSSASCPVNSVCTPLARASVAAALASCNWVTVELVERVGDVDVGGLSVLAECS